MKTSVRSNKGIGLIEILMTMFVLAVGVIGVAGLNSVIGRQSFDNKAQAEAQAIAQSRIEQIRNYSNAVTSSLAGFNNQYSPIANGNSLTINGINAVFTRTETRVNSGEDKNIQVNVTWTNAGGDTQTVTLNTTVSYINPRTIGDGGNGAAAGGAQAPTGRAELGDGTVPAGSTLEPSNGDGTTLFEDGDDLKLVDCTNPDPAQTNSTNCSKIVLTLANACINDPCTAFAKIQGTVYVNTVVGSGQFPQPSEMFLVASDAAFCSRYYMSGTTLNKVTASTAMNDIPLTATGSAYRSFKYTCYVGGGWHGNIGFVFNGSGNNPSKGLRGCTGDPVTTNGLKTPRVAIRRAYRGLLFKYGPNGPSDPHVQINNMERLYSHGIIDGAQLTGHDFVMAKINDVNSECKTIAMVGAGSNSGNLFAGQPRDFFCLNNGYLDEFDTTKFGYDAECPFDPTNPPSSKYRISGVVRLTAASNSTNQALATGMLVKTSDGTTCENPSDADAPLSWTHNGTYYEASYACGVYDWGTQAVPIGWTGDIQLTYNTASVHCTPSSISYSAVQADDTSGNDFTGCSVGAAAVWQGTVTQNGGGSAATKVINTVTMTGTGVSAGVNGTCTVPAGGLSYSCTTAQFFGTWTGNLVFTSGGAPITAGETFCPTSTSTTKTYSVSGVTGTYTQNLTIGCDVGVTATWTGTVSQVGNGGTNGKTISSVTMLGTGTSAGTNGNCTVAGNGLSYTCTTAPFGTSWSGTLNFTSAGGAICPYIPAAVTTKTYSFSNQSSGNKTQNLIIGRGSNGNGC